MKQTIPTKISKIHFINRGRRKKERCSRGGVEVEEVKKMKSVASSLPHRFIPRFTPSFSAAASSSSRLMSVKNSYGGNYPPLLSQSPLSPFKFSIRMASTNQVSIFHQQLWTWACAFAINIWFFSSFTSLQLDKFLVFCTECFYCRRCQPHPPS